MLTDFANQGHVKLTKWELRVWQWARNRSFVQQFTGPGENAMIQRVSELTKTEQGERAIIRLLADLESDGVAGDNELEGNEEDLKTYEQIITIGQLRNASMSKGRMMEQVTVEKFRHSAKNVLGYWTGDRWDQMAFLTMSGVSYAKTNNGATRTAEKHGSALAELPFAADVTAPSANRHRRWDAGAASLVAGDTTAVVAADTPSYKMLVELKAYAKDKYIRSINSKGNVELFHVFMTPSGMAKLKLDADYIANIRNAGVRGNKNELFAGSSGVLVDGMMIHEFRHVYNTKGATSGVDKWGAGSDVDGQRVLFCGAQALALADIGKPTWEEIQKDYKNRQGIAVGKMCGLLKPQFHSNVDGAVEDFGVICCDTAI